MKRLTEALKRNAAFFAFAAPVLAFFAYGLLVVAGNALTK